MKNSSLSSIVSSRVAGCCSPSRSCTIQHRVFPHSVFPSSPLGSPLWRSRPREGQFSGSSGVLFSFRFDSTSGHPPGENNAPEDSTSPPPRPLNGAAAEEAIGNTVSPSGSKKTSTAGVQKATRRRTKAFERVQDDRAPHEEGDSSSAAPLNATASSGIPLSAATASPRFLPDLGMEGGLRFFSKMEADSTVKESLLCYNTITGRMMSYYSPHLTTLRSIGFELNENKQLVVANMDALNAEASRIRSGEKNIADLKLPNSIVKTLSPMLTSPRITNPADVIDQLLKTRIKAILLARQASVVTSDTTTGGSATSEAVGHGGNDEEVELNEEQERVIDIAMRGHHVYIGGSAGTGKTVLLRVLFRRLQMQRLRVAMTATTGVAGCHIGGCTFHHAFGVSSQGEFVRRSGILDYDVVIIDEVSMMSQQLFEEFDAVLREESGTPDLPFGGVQIILCGDFLQLGSINNSSIIYSRVFRENFVKMRLEKIVRQNAFPQFAEDLQLLRRGVVPEGITEKIQQLPPGTMVPSAVNLLPTNKEVHQANEEEMQRLEGDPIVFTPETGVTALRCDTTVTMLLRTTPEFNADDFGKHVRSLLQATLDLPRASLLSLYKVYEDGHAMRVILPASETVSWKEAMRERFLEIAPLINELDLGAVVTEIIPKADGLQTEESEQNLQKQMLKHPIVQPLTLKKGCRVLLRSNLSAVLVNGSVGTVVDFVECKQSNFSDCIQHETMSSCIERYRGYCMTECAMPIPLVPVVQFHNGKTIAIPPMEFIVGGTSNTEYYSLSSVCIPLTLAYAFTVHKVQGLTLVGRVHLELSRMWPCEHLLYVAMSRVRNPDQLSMSSFEPGMIVANRDCVEFDKKLLSAKDITQEVLKNYPVSSWKRCTDTIYHLRRRGSSLRTLIKSAAMRGGIPSERAEGSASEALAPDAGEVGEAVPSETLDSHALAVENSVIVARRMRKLIRHVERLAKMQAQKERQEKKRKRKAPDSSESDARATADIVDF